MGDFGAHMASQAREAEADNWLLAESEWKRTGQAKAEESEISLTPTEELLLELLIARTRLGHHWWTIGSNAASRKAAKGLEDKGLVVVMNGIVEKTFRAHLTDDARPFMDNDYTPPILGGPK